LTYWDTSALLKLYALEPDSHFFRGLAGMSAAALLTAEIAKVEMLCALHRKESAGDLKPGGADALFAAFLSDIGRGRIVAVAQSEVVLRAIRRLLADTGDATPLRSLDALHLGSALSSGAEVFVATDKRLREAAGRVGLVLEP
jgi:uncharacterized protein